MSVTVSSEYRERIAATYHRFRQSNSGIMITTSYALGMHVYQCISFAVTGSSISFTERQNHFNEHLKQHHFGDKERDSFTRIFVSRQELLQSVSISVMFGCEVTNNNSL